MTQQEFVDRYRAVFLGWLSEAYCFRKLAQSEFGQVMDEQRKKLEGLLRQMHDVLSAPPVNGNGHPKRMVIPEKVG